MQGVHEHCDQGEEAQCRVYMYTVTKGKRHSAGCTCHTKTRECVDERNIVMMVECV